jgi:ATPase subunit of ABC transporter with duplicated ATPase domains
MIDLPHFEQEINLMFDYEVQIPRGKMLLTLRIPELSVELTEGRKLLSRDIRLEIRSNEKVCIIGTNGAGKTTLLKRIREELSKRTDTSFAYMPQNYEELLDPEKTPEEFIARTGSKEERIIINNRLASLRFTPDDMNRRIGELSGGQKAKLLLLWRTLSGADILLLDEPTRNSSPLSGPVIRGILRDFSGAIISVSHDRKYINEVPDRTYELTQEGLSLLIH